MKRTPSTRAVSTALAWLFAAFFCASTPAQTSDPLPSWNDGAAKRAIVGFVQAATRDGGAEYIEPGARIATFDNDGTLWAEQPLYFQLLFAIDRVKALAPQHPEWKDKQPFASLLKGDMKAALAGGEHALAALVAASHAGISTDEFNRLVKDWLATARHPKTGRLYTQMAYRPMLELLDYLRANGFKTFIVSGGGVEFIRAFAESTYGIPPEQVIGSTGVVSFEEHGGKPVLMKQPKVEFVDDGPGKPVAINRVIGRRPVAAFGNSDGDLQMLQYTAAGPGRHLALLVHHDDAKRETAYDRDSRVGRLDKALLEAMQRHWVVVSMQKDWNKVFAFE